MYHEGVIYSLGGEYFADADDETFRSLLQNPAYANVDRDIVLDNQVYSFTLEDMNWTVHSHMTTKRKRHQVSCKLTHNSKENIIDRVRMDLTSHLLSSDWSILEFFTDRSTIQVKVSKINF